VRIIRKGTAGITNMYNKLNHTYCIKKETTFQKPPAVTHSIRIKTNLHVTHDISIFFTKMRVPSIVKCYCYTDCILFFIS